MNKTVFWALHTGTRTGITGSGSRCGFNVVSGELHTTCRLCVLQYWTGFYTLSRSNVTQHSTQLGSGSMPGGSKVVFGSGSQFRIGLGFKILCGGPHYAIAVAKL